MALSNDQKAMLRLLAQREQGYEDIAALMGLSVDDVRARVKDALAELERSEPPVQEAPRAAEPPPEPPQPVEPPAPAKPAEQAEEPAPSEAPGTAGGAGPSSPRRAPVPGRPQLALPKDRGARIGLGAGAAVVVLLVILLVSGVLGDDGDSGSSASTTSGPTDAPNVTAANSKQLTQAILEPTDGGDASGRALFGRFKKNVLLQVEAEGLEPSPKGQSYTVWLYRSPKVVLRVGAVKVNDSGGITAQFPIPTQLLAYVASGAFNQIDVSLTSDAEYKAEVARAKAQERLPVYQGTSILRGRITGPAIKK